MHKEEHCQRGGGNPAHNIEITDCACWECGDIAEVVLHGHAMCPECVLSLLDDPAYTLMEKTLQNANMDDLELSMNVSNDGFQELLGLDAEITVNGIVFTAFLPLNRLEAENER